MASILAPKKADRPLEQGKTPSQIAEEERQRRLRFRGAASTTLAGSTRGDAFTRKEASDQKTTLGGTL